MRHRRISENFTFIQLVIRIQWKTKSSMFIRYLTKILFFNFSTMSRIQTLLRVAWTQFDDSYINVGLFSLVESVMFLMTNEAMSLEWIIYRTGCALLQAALLTDKTDSDGSARTLLLVGFSLDWTWIWQSNFRWLLLSRAFRLSFHLLTRLFRFDSRLPPWYQLEL